MKVSAAVDFYSDSTCTVAVPLGGPGVGGEDSTLADGAWHPSSNAFDVSIAPAGARRARLRLRIIKPMVDGSATVYFDNVVLRFEDEIPLHGRFRVTATWATPEASGPARMVHLTDGTAYLWFFDPHNVEVVIKVLDACVPFGRYWVFAGGLTNVEVDITVTDSQTGQTKSYHNDWNVPFAPLQDTDTFAACP